MVGDHLEEGGVITQWVPLYETTAEAVAELVGRLRTEYEAACRLP